MANPEHVEQLKQGVDSWNSRREANPSMVPELSGANLTQADLAEANLTAANFRGANLTRANLTGAILSGANLSHANLRWANLSRVNLSWANLTGAILSHTTLTGADLAHAKLIETSLAGANLRGVDLRDADLRGANLTRANLTESDLSEANLESAILVDTVLERANLSGSSIFGIAAWNVHLKNAKQSNLVITRSHEPEITVDNLAVAQFIYLLLNNKEIRGVIDTITSKAVLILGRFTEERKAVLDALRDELRKRGYLPILFDFEKPGSRDLTETISTLAHMARFIIADITDAKSIPQELQAIVPNLPSVAVQPLIARSAYEYALFEHIKRYPWVLATYQYEDTAQLLASLAAHVIEPAEAKVKELRPGV